MTVGYLVLVQTLLMQLSFPLNFLGTAYRDLNEAALDVGELIQITERKSAIQEAPDAKDLDFVKGDIEFRNVSYEASDGKEILKKLSFKEGGQKTGIVGESGCGKTTLFKLLFRLLDPSEGEIYVDG